MDYIDIITYKEINNLEFDYIKPIQLSSEDTNQFSDTGPFDNDKSTALSKSNGTVKKIVLVLSKDNPTLFTYCFNEIPINKDGILCINILAKPQNPADTTNTIELQCKNSNNQYETIKTQNINSNSVDLNGYTTLSWYGTVTAGSVFRVIAKVTYVEISINLENNILLYHPFNKILASYSYGYHETNNVYKTNESTKYFSRAIDQMFYKYLFIYQNGKIEMGGIIPQHYGLYNTRYLLKNKQMSFDKNTNGNLYFINFDTNILEKYTQSLNTTYIKHYNPSDANSTAAGTINYLDKNYVYLTIDAIQGKSYYSKNGLGFTWSINGLVDNSDKFIYYTIKVNNKNTSLNKLCKYGIITKDTFIDSKSTLINITAYKDKNNNSIVNDLKYIENDAFNGFSNLTSFNIGTELSYIGKNAFKDCVQLQNIKFGKTTYIDDNAFNNCNKLPNTLTISATYIGKSSFENCSTLKNITITNFSKIHYVIQENAFKNCNGLESVTIDLTNGSDMPDEWDILLACQIKNNVFEGCTTMKKLYFKCENNIINRLTGISKTYNYFGLPKNCKIYNINKDGIETLVYTVQ